MKSHFVVLILAQSLFILGCTTDPKNNQPDLESNREQTSPKINAISSPKRTISPKWPNAYIGVKGYFGRPPIFEGADQESQFQRCLPVTIWGVENKNGVVIVSVKQNEKMFRIRGLNRKSFRLNYKNHIADLDRYLLKDLKWRSGSARTIASESSSVCNGQIAQKMSDAEFLFAVGSPEKVVHHQKDNQKVQEWIYQGRENRDKMSYFFAQGKCYAWSKK